MRSKTLGQLFADLSITHSFSRPRVSNDNPFSEALFKTLKYRPDFPKAFDSTSEAVAHCHDFVQWYNHEHKHAGIAYLTPQQVHDKQHVEILDKRRQVRMKAFHRHPERFPHGPPKEATLKHEVWINPPNHPDDRPKCQPETH